MTIILGNAPCSWGVEFPDDPRNPSWQSVLSECKEAGYRGIELGPVGFMPEDVSVLGDALHGHDLTLIGGMMMQAFHDRREKDVVMSVARRTCKALSAQEGEKFVIIDSISKSRNGTSGRDGEAERLSRDDRRVFIERIATVAKMGAEEYGLTPCLHPHAATFCEFRDEIEALMDETDEKILKLCLDTGHSFFAGWEPLDCYRTYSERVAYVHLKDVSKEVMSDVKRKGTDFYDACGERLFCRLGEGAVDFSGFGDLLKEKGYEGWATIEQDCDPRKSTSPKDDALYNMDYLDDIGFCRP